jgi:hypothetical protein
MDIICVNSHFTEDVLQFYAKFGVKIPEQDKIYTLRDKRFHSNGKFGVLLEEIVNPKVPIESSLLPDASIEPTFDAKRFTDLLGNDLTKHIEYFETSLETNLVKENDFYKNLNKK